MRIIEEFNVYYRKSCIGIYYVFENGETEYSTSNFAFIGLEKEDIPDKFKRTVRAKGPVGFLQQYMTEENRVKGTRKKKYLAGDFSIVRLPKETGEKYWVYRRSAEKGEAGYSEKNHSAPHYEGPHTPEGMEEWASWYCFNKLDDGCYQAELDEAWWWGGGHNDGGTIRNEIPEEWFKLSYDEFLQRTVRLSAAAHYGFTVEELKEKEGLKEFFGFDRERNIVYFDIDGTLATGKNVPESAAKAIEQLREKGDLVFICTGRNVAYARDNFGAYADGFICNNGRIAVLGDEVLLEKPLSYQQIQEIIRILEPLDTAYIFHGNERGYAGGNPEGFKVLEDTGDKGHLTRCDDFSQVKVYSFDTWVRDREHLAQITEAFRGKVLVNPHGPHPSADMTIEGYDKGDAALAVAERLGVKRENTFAFGDGINDISMLVKAGHGIAMGNGFEEVKKAAEYVTTGINDDGVANGLKHYGLI